MSTKTLIDVPPTVAPKPKETKRAPKITVVSDNEWLALFVNLYRKICPGLTNVLCLGKFTDVNMLHKAYTGSVILNPLYCSKAEAMAADKESRFWVSNIQAIGDDVPSYQDLLAKCLVNTEALAARVVVLTDEPETALPLFTFPLSPLVVSPKPVPGFRGSLRVRCKNRDYLYFFNCEGRCQLDYDTDMLVNVHHIFSSNDDIDKIFINFNQSDLATSLTEMAKSCPSRCEVIPLQYLDTTFKIADQKKVTVPTSGIPQMTDLAAFALKLTPELLVYNPVEMRETSLYSAIRNPLYSAAVGYDETVALYKSLGLEFPDSDESRQRMDKHAAFYRQQTIPMIKPTGDQLLAYYRPGYYTAQSDYLLTLNEEGKRVPAFVKGKKYYIYPVQHSEVIELPETKLLEADSKTETTRKMSLHCTYTALSLTSELKSSEIAEYSKRSEDDFSVVTAEEYELARKISQAQAMGNQVHAEELRKRLKAQYGRRLHITSKDPNLSQILDVFPPPEVKTLSEGYPHRLKQRVALLTAKKAPLTDVQVLHAGLASLKRGVVFTHNVGSGKTRIAAYAAIAAGARRVALIAKSKILGELVREMRDELGMDVVHIRSASCIQQLKEQIKAEARQRKRDAQQARISGKALPEPEKKTTFYLISQEFLTIGGLANQSFDPYVVDVSEILVSPATTKIHSLICTRENAEKEIKEQIIRKREEGEITGNVKRVPFRFSMHVQECPRCMEGAARRLFNVSKRKSWIDLSSGTREAIREQTLEYIRRGKMEAGVKEFGTFSKQGHCRVCGYLARSYRRVTQDETETTAEVAELLEALGDEEKASNQKPNRDFYSALQFPAYRLLKDLFDTKICDEAHTLTGDSMVYEAVKSIHTERTYLLSGTLLRRTPAEMWQVFTLLWGYRAPEFPYGFDEQDEFIEQHVTYRVTREIVDNPNSTKKPATRTQKQEMPEPANAPKLWKFLHQAQLHATNKSMGLSIPKVQRHFMAIPLEGKILEEYDQTLKDLQNTFVKNSGVFSLQQRADSFTRMNELQAIALKAKLDQLMPVVQEMVESGRNIIVACKLHKTFDLLCAKFDADGVEYVKLDEKKPAQPHKRRDWIDENYVRSKKPVLLTRTPLINESLNNLVKASALLVVEPEYVFYPLQQLEGRIARPKQKAETVNVIYMITRHPTRVSIDEAMIQMALRRNNANVELVSGNVTQRTNEQLVEMAENQKMRELELMQTLLEEIKPAKEVDYRAEFEAREAEIERSERQKATIIVDSKLRGELAGIRHDRTEVGTAEAQTVAPAEVPMETPPVQQSPVLAVPSPVAAVTRTPVAPQESAAAGIQEFNLEFDLDVPRVTSPIQKKRQRIQNQLKQAFADLRQSRSDEAENLTLF